MNRQTAAIAGQFLAVGVAMLDRLALTAYLIRFWGTAVFEHWSILLAATSLFTLFDLGFQMHFSNRLTLEAAMGKERVAQFVYRSSNTIFLGLAICGALVAVVIFSVSGPRKMLGVRDALSLDDRWITAALILAIATKLAMTNLISVYRLHRAFGRGNALASLVDAVRILLVAGLAISGFGPISAAIATTFVTVLGFGLLIPADISRRFPDFRMKFDRPTMLTMEGAFSNGGMFFLQNFPNLAINQLPVLLIGNTASATGVLASFLLIRTLLNFSRLLIFQVVQILGMECARLAAEDRWALLDRLYRHTNLCVAAVSGCLCGGMLSFGRPILTFWTGQPGLYRHDLMLVMIVPLLCVPSSLLANTFLSYSNRPFYPTLGRGLHFCVAVLLFFLVPFEDISLRLTFAIYIGEVIGFALPQIYASPRVIDQHRILTEAFYVASCVAAFGATYLVAIVTKTILPPDVLWRFSVDILVTGGGATLTIWVLLLRPSQLHALTAGIETSDV
ncbi:Membrane protein involved in the export of O-antigen and teichoic acid [Rhizobiales bacterium GAS113]|nr:Membrane protein involved in the export of O-antigen and teichoic acid [Rhizobiales bacterium GAS113]